MNFQINPSKVSDSTITVPGDKSVSHRALMLGGIATGKTNIKGFLAGKDCLSTMTSMKSLGIKIEILDETEMSIHGVGLNGLSAPKTDLDLGNSGTAMRLMAGLLAGQEFSSNLIGDASLSGRPMGRIIKPLSQMGAIISSDENETPPLQISGSSKLKAIHYDLPIASAQVKSSILLAGLYADGTTSLIEPAITRDHTERMLISMGANVTKIGNKISIEGKPKIFGRNVNVPADLSSASFVILAALISENADILIKNVGINPTRTGVIEILKSMGADITLEKKLLISGEPVADIRVRSSKLKGSAIDPKLVSLAIDEFPVLFVAAAASIGKTTFSGIGELRVKESDRITAMSKGLQNMGIKVDEYADGAVIYGGEFSGGLVQSFGDHRIAMSLAIAGTIANDQIIVKDIESVDTSFPGFCECMANIGANIRTIEAE
tara:strand:+ start:453 stop:1760 length:1308 start_codon:yes stop_codon:yes gene_type:complete